MEHSLTDALQALDPNHQNLPSDPVSSSRVGDSGYVSFPGALPLPFGHLDQYSRIAESDADASSATQIELLETEATAVPLDKYVGLHTGGSPAPSAVSSTFPDDAERDLGCDSWRVPTPQVLEQLSRTGKKGSMRSEVQLRYARTGIEAVARE